MSRSCLRVACLLPVLFVVAPAFGQGAPRGIGDCERLKNDLAYNQCLAMFGPAAKNIAGGDGVSSGAPAPAPSYSEEAIAAAGIPSADEPELDERSRRGRRGRSARRGRQSASFAVAGVDDSASGSSGSSGHRRYRRRH